ncbi:hypothetical protein ABFS82_14G238800 [Erythranthe guttata]|uniref:DUF674 domain-containing protein n=1 Tax=Erythranthe guttata TaxID=4155 RepID=A0A022R6N7_ERYGU|nr:PREDICTED: uncharacterized protein LOC105958706 [Erythranthe guttata]EYU36132.1 hypothetical protein MIMGU_mgv1a024373mg [Erythranthe guttata]|eukprot:XP_012838167.1 PREDICTED: uncharacterized protein LOC105958706 [Erythranthe guttata]
MAAAAAAEEESKATTRLKLLIDTKGKRVLYAEAGKEFADFLFQILSLPLATIVSLLRKRDTFGSLTNLYESMENLNDSYMQYTGTKDSTLKPVPPVNVPLLGVGNKISKCSVGSSFASKDRNATCPSCKKKLFLCCKYKEMRNAGLIFKDMVTYMVMDDLTVTPLSTMSSIALLRKHHINQFSDQLEEKIVDIGMDEALKLLNATLRTKKVLTDVFLENSCSVKREVDII